MLLSAKQVCAKVGISYTTLNHWYHWYRNTTEKPEGMPELPPPIQIDNKERCINAWKIDDVEKLIIFKNWIPQGRNGVMGKTTQRYVKNNIKKEKTGCHGKN